MTDPRFRPRLRAGLDLFEDWSADAACRRYSSPGAPWSWMFADEVAERPEGTEYEFPDKVLQAMQVCAGCPVRQECAEWAYEFEKGVDQAWWSGELVEQDRRFGIFGGLPGRMRERFAAREDRIAAGEEWFTALSRKRNWVHTDRKKETA
jgi:hypothetical protein